MLISYSMNDLLKVIGTFDSNLDVDIIEYIIVYFKIFFLLSISLKRKLINNNLLIFDLIFYTIRVQFLQKTLTHDYLFF